MSTRPEPFITFSFLDGTIKRYSRLCIKEHVMQIQALTTEDDYKPKLEAIEYKALVCYFYKLLGRMDYLSQKLFQKGKLAGFYEEVIFKCLDDLKLKGYLNDERLLERKALKKIKKGYSIKMTGSSLTNCPKAKEEEAFALKKLIKKKQTLLLSSDQKLKARGYRFFISRGYDINQIKELVCQIED